MAGFGDVFGTHTVIIIMWDAILSGRMWCGHTYTLTILQLNSTLTTSTQTTITYLKRATDPVEHMLLKICWQEYSLALWVQCFSFPSGCLVVVENTMGHFSHNG